jgi:hypothetical protein
MDVVMGENCPHSPAASPPNTELSRKKFEAGKISAHVVSLLARVGVHKLARVSRRITASLPTVSLKIDLPFIFKHPLSLFVINERCCAFILLGSQNVLAVTVDTAVLFIPRLPRMATADQSLLKNVNRGAAWRRRSFPVGSSRLRHQPSSSSM